MPRRRAVKWISDSNSVSCIHSPFDKIQTSAPATLPLLKYSANSILKHSHRCERDLILIIYLGVEPKESEMRPTQRTEFSLGLVFPHFWACISILHLHMDPKS